MKAYFHRRYHLSASHRLASPALSDEANRATYGKCANPHGHGHNYIVELCVSGPIDPATGMVIDMAELDRMAQETIVARYDHQNLNTLDEFQHLVPTTENLCIEIYNRVRQALRGAALEHVRVEETANNFFEYAGG